MFPIWIKSEKGDILFVTDEIMEKWMREKCIPPDYRINHHLTKIILGEDGVHEQFSPVPSEILEAIRNGKMDKIMKASGVEFTYNQDELPSGVFKQGRILETFFKNGEMIYKRKYFDSGVVAFEAGFRNGEINGECFAYHPDGRVWVKEIYQEGILVEAINQ